MAPHPLMDGMHTVAGTQRLKVYLVLHRHGHGSADGCWTSLATLAKETGIKRDDVCLALRWLVENGWAVRESRPGKTSSYFLRMDQPTPLQGATPSGVGTPPEVATTYPPTGGHHLPPHRGAQTISPEQHPRNNIPEEVEPPVSPASGGTDQPAAAAVEIVRDPQHQQPAPAALAIQPPPDPAPKRKAASRKPAAFSPTAEDIDVHLLPVQRQLLAFWAGKVEYKRGVPSQAAWDLLQAALLRIQQDPEGGTHVVAEQLDAGIQAGWSSVTYANWQRYGKPARVRYGSQTAAPRGPDAWDAVTEFANWRDSLQQHTPEPVRYAV